MFYLISLIRSLIFSLRNADIIRKTIFSDRTKKGVCLYVVIFKVYVKRAYFKYMLQLFYAKEKVQIPVHTESKQSQLLIPFRKEDSQPGMSILSPFQAQIVSYNLRQDR